MGAGKALRIVAPDASVPCRSIEMDRPIQLGYPVPAFVVYMVGPKSYEG